MSVVETKLIHKICQYCGKGFLCLGNCAKHGHSPSLAARNCTCDECLPSPLAQLCGTIPDIPIKRKANWIGGAPVPQI